MITIANYADSIKAGGIVAFPTETVYGLGADAGNDAAVAKIFAAKGRPADHPLIVHVASASAVAQFATHVPVFAEKLMAAFWPGPLTVILPRQSHMATASAGGQASIGLRCPSHPLALELLHACAQRGVNGVAAPSANRFGKLSPTTAQHVRDEFVSTLGDALPILDGGACSVGIESAIIDCTRGAPVLLRPGALSTAQIEAAMGQKLLLNNEQLTQVLYGFQPKLISKTDAPISLQTPKTSGTLASHYAPRASLRLMDSKALQTALDMLGDAAAHMAVYSRVILASRSSHIIRRRMPDDPIATAQQLFAVLRDFDDHNVKLIWVETPPADPEWDGVRDRLERAAA